MGHPAQVADDLFHGGDIGCGTYAYVHLGSNEDPPFTIRVMVVQTLWPGATQDETMRQVTDRIEKKAGGDTPS